MDGKGRVRHAKNMAINITIRMFIYVLRALKVKLLAISESQILLLHPLLTQSVYHLPAR